MSDDCIASGPGDEEETSGSILDSEVDDLYGIEEDEDEEEFEDDPEDDDFNHEPGDE